MRYKLLIFDLDGTLIDSIPDISDVFNSVLEDHGFPILPADAYYSRVGWGLKRTLELILPDGEAGRGDLTGMLETVLRRYARRPARRSCVYPGIIRMLEDLASRKVQMIVCTNKEQSIAESILSELFPDSLFSHVIGHTGDFPAKPDPGALNHYLEGKNMELSSILFVGDTPVDRETAYNAGIEFAGVTWGFRTAEELLESGSLLNFNAPAELHRWLLGEEHHEN